MKVTLFLLFFVAITFNACAQNSGLIETINGVPLDGWIYHSTSSPAYRYCDGIKCNGLITDTFPNGNKELKAVYANGKLHGQVIHYYPNGQIESVGNCEHGAKIDEWVFYYESGQIKSELTYDTSFAADAKKSVDYYENGNIESQYEYSDGDFILYHFEFSESGDTIFAQYPTDWESRVFMSRSYHSNGLPEEIGQHQYLDGRWMKRGIWKTFDEEGHLIKSENYEK